MNGRFLLVGTIVGALASFAWGFVSHMLIPWWEKVMFEFADSGAVVAVIQANAPKAGIYFAPHGVFAAVRIDPNFTGQMVMGPHILRQFVNELVTAFLLSLFVLRTGAGTAGAAAGTLGLAALAAASSQLIPDWNWYNFSPGFIALEFFDIVIGWIVIGLVLGFLRSKMTPVPAA